MVRDQPSESVSLSRHPDGLRKKPRKTRAQIGAAATNMMVCLRMLGVRSTLSMSGFYGSSLLHSTRAERRVYVSSVGHSVWLRPADMGTFAEVFLRQQYAIGNFRDHAASLQQCYEQLAGEALIIDCGANIGLSTVWFCRRFPQAAIYAVEPAAPNVFLLRENTRAMPNVHVVEGAVWLEPASLAFAYNDDRPSGALVTPSGAHLVRGYSIGEITDMAKQAAPLIVKIDIEGSEKALFGGDTSWVERTKLIMIETHDWMFPFQSISRSFWACISQKGFDIVHSGDTTFCFNHTLWRQ